MQDIVDKVDRAKAILLPLIHNPGAVPSEDDAKALAAIGIDLIGEFVANSRRTAVAMESLAGNIHKIGDDPRSAFTIARV